MAGRRFRLRPRLRMTELSLLAVVAVTLTAGAVSLGATQQYRAVIEAGGLPKALELAPPDAQGLLAYLLALFGVHLLLVVAGRRLDEILLPAVAMLGGIGLLLMQRLPQDLVTQSIPFAAS